MWVSEDCFSDVAIRRYINANGNIGECDVTGSFKPVVDAMELADFLLAVVSQFYVVDTKGISLVNAIQDDWHFFSNAIVASSIIDTILSNAQSQLSSQSRVCLVAELQYDDWSRLKNDVKYVNRFMLDVSEYHLDEYICGSNNEIVEGSTLYRARINEYGVSKYTLEQMGCPPKDICTPGRANPQGIPYMYLSEDAETTLYEVRSTLLDRISIGKFLIVSNLKIFDFDFNVDVDLFEKFNDDSSSDLITPAKQKKFLERLCEDMSKPLHRNDSTLEYVPTQLVCEFCKVNNIDGIRYRSAMHKEGTNVVVFNQDAVKCISVDVFKIEDMELKALKD